MEGLGKRRWKGIGGVRGVDAYDAWALVGEIGLEVCVAVILLSAFCKKNKVDSEVLGFVASFLFHSIHVLASYQGRSSDADQTSLLCREPTTSAGASKITSARPSCGSCLCLRSFSNCARNLVFTIFSARDDLQMVMKVACLLLNRRL